MMKKILSVFLVFALCLSMCPSFSFANEPPATLALSFAPTDVVSNEDGTMLYLSSRDEKKVYSINTETFEQKTISFDLMPEALYYRAGKLYVGLCARDHSSYWYDVDQVGAFAIIDGTNLSLLAQHTIYTDPYDIVVSKDNNIYISPGSGQHTDLFGYKPDGTLIGNSNSIHKLYQGTQIEYNETLNRIYAQDSNEAKSYNLGADGKISLSTYKFGGSGASVKFKISPDGKYLYSFSNSVLNCNADSTKDLTLKTDGYINGYFDFKDIEFDLINNTFYCATANKIMSFRYSTGEPVDVYGLTTGNVQRIFLTNDRFIAITKSQNDKYSIEMIDKNNHIEPNTDYEYGDYVFRSEITAGVYSEKTNKTYAIDRGNKELIVFDNATQSVETKVPLKHRPDDITLSEDGTKLLIVNDNIWCAVSEIDISTLQNTRNIIYPMLQNFNPIDTHRRIAQGAGKLFITSNYFPYSLQVSTHVFDYQTLQYLGNYGLTNDTGYIYIDNESKHAYFGDISSSINDKKMYKYDIAGERAVLIAKHELSGDWYNAPAGFNSPIIPFGDRIIYKDKVFKTSNISVGNTIFPESIYAISETKGLAVGKNGIYNLYSGALVKKADFNNSNLITFDKDGNLFFSQNQDIKKYEFKSFRAKISSDNGSLKQGETAQTLALGLYSDGVESDITSLCTFSSSDPNVATVDTKGLIKANNNGTAVITVFYNGLKSTFAVGVGVGVDLKSISVEGYDMEFTTEKTDYSVIVKNSTTTAPTVSYIADENVKVVINNAIAIPGKTTVTVNDSAGTMIKTYTINFIRLSEIHIAQKPSKIKYFVNEPLDIRDMKVLGLYSDGSEVPIQVTEENISGFNSEIAAVDQVLTVTVEGKTDTYKINIWRAAPTGLAGVMPTSQSINNGKITGVGAGMEYTNIFDYEFKPITGKEVTMLKPGKYFVRYIADSSQLPSCESLVIVPKHGEVVLTGLSVKNNKTTYMVGEELDRSSLVITGTYSDGTTKIEPVENILIEGFNSNSVAERVEVKIQEGYYSTSFIVSIVENTIPGPTGIEVVAPTNSNNNDGKIIGVTPDMEFIQFFYPTPITGTEIENLTPGTYSIRFKGSAGKPPSRPTNVSVPSFTPKTLNHIEITNLPNKLTYLVGEPLDLIGLGVKGTYSDGTEKNETIAVDDVFGFNSRVVTQGQVLTVVVGQQTATFTVDIVDSTQSRPYNLKGIAPTSIADNDGKITGVTPEMEYKLKTETTYIAVSGTEISGIAAGIYNVRFKAQGESEASVTTDVIVPKYVAPRLIKIAITTPPNKLIYSYGEIIDITDMVVTGTYSDGSTKIETVTKESLFPSYVYNPGQGVVEVNIAGQIATFEIYVRPQSIAAPENLYGVAPTSATSNDGKITGVTTAMEYAINGLDTYIPVTGSEIINLEPGQYNVRFKANPPNQASLNKTVTVPACSPKTLSSIRIMSSPQKYTYFVGDTLDITGLSVVGVYSDGSDESIYNITARNVTGFDSSVAVESQEITVTVNGKTATFTVSIINRDKGGPIGLKGVAPTTEANNDGKIIGATIAMEYKLSTATTYTKVTGTELANLAPGTYNVRYAARVGYNASADADVVVPEFAPASPNSIWITKLANKLIYKVGETLDITGMVVTGKYSDGSEKVETITADNVTGFDSSVANPGQTLTVTVGGKTATYIITILNAPGGLTGVAPTTEANNNGKITGVTTAMEYKLSTETTYTTVTGTEILNLSAGTYNVRFTASDGHSASAATDVVVPAYTQATLNSIEVTTPANKLTYKVGETLDITGLVVTGTYSDGTEKTETITANNVTGFDSSEAVESQTLTVTVNDKTTTYTISIENSNQDAPSGLAGVAPTTEDNNDGKITGVTNEMEYKLSTETTYTAVTGTEILNLASGTYNVRFAARDGFSASADTDVVVPAYTQATLNSIEVTTTANKLTYKVGETLDITGLVVTGTYSDGTEKTETITANNVTGFDSSEAVESQTLIITVNGKTATYTISIENSDQDAPSGLAGVAPTTKANNNGKITCVTTGMEYKLSTATTYTAVTGTEILNLSAGTYNVRFAARDGYNASADTNVVVPAFTQATLDSIEVTTPANKLTYKIGETLDITGLVVTGTYSDGSEKTETITANNVTGFDSTQASESQTLTVTVNDKTATYTISIINNGQDAPSGLAGVAPTTEANNNGKITGVTAEMEYKLSTETTYTTVTGTEILNLSAGTYNVRFAARHGFNASADTDVVVPAFTQATLDSIEVTTPANKLTYKIGETLDITGLVVTGTYSDGSEKTETITANNVTGFDSSEAVESQNLTITVSGKTATFDIVIRDYEMQQPLVISGIPDTVSFGDEPFQLSVTGGSGNGKITYTVTPNTSESIQVNEDGLASIVKAGECTIIATKEGDNNYKSITAMVTVNVLPIEPKLKTLPTAKTISVGNNLASSTLTGGVVNDKDGKPMVGTFSWKESNKTMNVAGTHKEIVIFTPSNLNYKTIEIGTVSVTVNSSNNNTGGGGGGSTTTLPSKVETTAVTPTTSLDNGVVTSTINASEIKKAVDGAKTVVISIPSQSQAEGYQQNLPADIVNERNSNAKIEIKTPVANITIPNNMFGNNASVTGKSGDTVGISMKNVDKSTLSSELQDQIGSRPVIELNASFNGSPLAYNNESAPVTISIPYMPTQEEKANPQLIEVLYIDGNGKVTKVGNSSYNEKTGMVTFKTTHFSTYAIANTALTENNPPVQIERTFNDLGGYDWAKTQIEELAASGIINGTGKETFSPGKNITRADFVTLLVRALKLTSDSTDNFDDVETSDYYYNTLAIAKKLGIITGVGDNKFNPKAAITRQDMMVITVRALKVANYNLTTSTLDELSGYTDVAKISEYAANDVATLIKSGIVAGSGNSINPLGYTTRAEIAVMIHRIINKK